VRADSIHGSIKQGETQSMALLMKPLNLTTLELKEAGQSPWLDFISRDLLRSGKLASFINEKGLLGVTSNPTIFQKSISQSDGSYEADIKQMAQRGRTTLEIYDALTVKDIQDACDLFKDVFHKTRGEHGFVSLEVLPNLAYDLRGFGKSRVRFWD